MLYNISKIFVLILMMVLYGLMPANAQSDITASKGIIDFRNTDFSQPIRLKVDGEWEFYWKKLYNPAFFDTTSNTDPRFVNFPSNWIDYKEQYPEITLKGYATFRLRILVPTQKKVPMALKVAVANSAGRLYINGVLVSEVGVVDSIAENVIPAKQPQIIDLPIDADTLDFVYQLASQHEYLGGAWPGFMIGNTATIHRHRQMFLEFDLFLLGAIMIMALYHLGLFLSRPKDKSTLYFALFCLLIAGRTLVTSERYILTLWPDASFYLQLRVEFLFLYLSPLVFTAFIHHILPSDLPKKVLRIIAIISAPFILIGLIGSSYNFTMVLRTFQIFMLTIGVYIIGVLILAAIRRREGIIILITGFAIFLFTFVNDVLYAMQLIKTFFLISFGLFFFIFSQAYLLSVRFSKSYTQSEELTKQLAFINENLEGLVKERTSEIEQQKEELRAQSESLIEAMNEIQKQKDELQRMNKQMRSSIQYASRIQNAVLPTEVWLQKLLPSSFIFWRPRDIVSGDFYWSRVSDNYLHIVVADCTGHGVPGAFVSLLGISYLNELVRKNTFEEPGTVLENMRQMVKQSFSQDEAIIRAKDGMDMAYCSINMNTLELRFAGANNPVFIVRNQELTVLKPTRNPIGTYRKELSFDTQSFQLLEEDMLYLFSDGYYDQVNSRYEKFKVNRFKQLLIDISQDKPETQKKRITENFESWCNQMQQVDDVLVIGLKVNRM